MPVVAYVGFLDVRQCRPGDLKVHPAAVCAAVPNERQVGVFRQRHHGRGDLLEPVLPGEGTWCRPRIYGPGTQQATPTRTPSQKPAPISER